MHGRLRVAPILVLEEPDAAVRQGTPLKPVPQRASVGGRQQCVNRQRCQRVLVVVVEPDSPEGIRVNTTVLQPREGVASASVAGVSAVNQVGEGLERQTVVFL
jgi:hypothetical protein